MVAAVWLVVFVVGVALIWRGDSTYNDRMELLGIGFVVAALVTVNIELLD